MKKGKNVIILKSEKTLDEIKVLLQQDYSCIDEGISNCSISIEEMTFNHRWENENGNFDKENINVYGSEVEVIQAYAIIEKNRFSGINRIRIGENGDIPLPKTDRVLSDKSLVLFCSYEGSTYIIVNGPKSIESKIRTLLMHQKKVSESDWGVIYNKNVGIYNFDTSFYTWILTNKGAELTDENVKLLFSDVRGFKSATERQGHIFSGQGSNIDKEIPFKSVVSLDEKIDSLHIEVKLNDRTTYSFALDSDGRLEVITTLCGDYLVKDPKLYSDKEIFLDIYFEIIPFLVKKFNESKKSDWLEKEKRLKKQYSEDIVKQFSQK